MCTLSTLVFFRLATARERAIRRNEAESSASPFGNRFQHSYPCFDPRAVSLELEHRVKKKKKKEKERWRAVRKEEWVGE